MNKKKLFNIVATIIFGLFLVIFNILYCTLVFVPFGYSSLLVSTFVICDSILLVFFVLEGVILFRTIIEEKEYIKTNEFIFGDKIEFDNLEMFVKKVSKIINTKKEEYIVSFSPIKTSVNYEIFQSKELKILNKELALYFTKLFSLAKYKTFKARVSYDNYCFIIFIRCTSDELLQLIKDVEYKSYSISKEKDIRIFIQNYFGICKIEQNVELLETINRSNIARKIGEYNFEKAIFFEKSMIEGKSDENMANAIVNALRNKEFIVYYMPKFHLQTKRFIGSEALVRWNSKDKGLISPIRFINFAENRGLIHEIDLYVLEQVCKDLEDQKKRGKRLLPVSINFSIYEFYTPTFLDDIKQVIEKYDVNPLLIEIEITEETTHANSFLVISILKKLKDMGLKILLDDFGLGFSNIKSMKILPIDIIKIDKSFIDEIVYDYKSREIVRAIISFGKALNLQVIAEGVVDAKQVEILKKMKCDQIQGFFYSKPIPKKEYESFLMNNQFEKKEDASL